MISDKKNSVIYKGSCHLDESHYLELNSDSTFVQGVNMPGESYIAKGRYVSSSDTLILHIDSIFTHQGKKREIKIGPRITDTSDRIYRESAMFRKYLLKKDALILLINPLHTGLVPWCKLTKLK
jgi:hypothetical protein